jgi:ATP-dependent Clp protease adaptor protein ClpS
MDDCDSGGGVAEPLNETLPRRKRQQRRKPKRQPRYNVILWNDDDHTYGYVITMLMQLFGYTSERGFQLAEQVDRGGKAIVLTTTLEHAELKRDQIHAFGSDGTVDGCQGSMWATVEPVDG